MLLHVERTCQGLGRHHVERRGVADGRVDALVPVQMHRVVVDPDPAARPDDDAVPVVLDGRVVEPLPGHVRDDVVRHEEVRCRRRRVDVNSGGPPTVRIPLPDVADAVVADLATEDGELDGEPRHGGRRGRRSDHPPNRVPQELEIHDVSDERPAEQQLVRRKRRSDDVIHDLPIVVAGRGIAGLENAVLNVRDRVVLDRVVRVGRVGRPGRRRTARHDPYRSRRLTRSSPADDAVLHRVARRSVGSARASDPDHRGAGRRRVVRDRHVPARVRRVQRAVDGHVVGAVQYDQAGARGRRARYRAHAAAVGSNPETAATALMGFAPVSPERSDTMPNVTSHVAPRPFKAANAPPTFVNEPKAPPEPTS